MIMVKIENGRISLEIAKKGAEMRKDFRQAFSLLTKHKFPMKINCKKVKFMLKWDYHIMFRKEGKAK